MDNEIINKIPKAILVPNTIQTQIQDTIEKNISKIAIKQPSSPLSLLELVAIFHPFHFFLI